MDIDRLEDEIGQMQEKVQTLEKTVMEQNQDSRLSVYKQQANLVARKKELVLTNKKALEEERDALAKELSMKEREYEQMKGHKFMKRDEFKNYAASLREKSAKFKRLKSELQDLRHECAVLTRTEQILQAKDPTPVGMRETEMHLEKVSVEKSNVDKAKGKTLDEISQIVQKINSQLKDKKNKLAPQIKALRSVRQNFTQVESKYLEKKAAYDQAKSQMDGDLSKVAGEVQQLETEVFELEQHYHGLHLKLCATESRLQRAQKEVRCLRNEDVYSNEFKSLSSRYTAELAQLNTTCLDLRQQTKRVKETHEDNIRQKKTFVELEALMRVKLKVAQQEMMSLAAGGAGGEMYATRALVDTSAAGVERMIIE